MFEPKTESFKSQMEHKPTKEYFNKIYKLVSNIKCDKALEIGSWWGISTIAILDAGNGHLTSVDKNLCPLAHAEVIAHDFINNWTFLMGDSKDILPQLKVTNNNYKYDFIFIDGSHEYEAVKNDLINSLELISDDGIILVDDYYHQNNKTGDYGVKKAVDELDNKLIKKI